MNLTINIKTNNSNKPDFGFTSNTDLEKDFDIIDAIEFGLKNYNKNEKEFKENLIYLNSKLIEINGIIEEAINPEIYSGQAIKEIYRILKEEQTKKKIKEIKEYIKSLNRLNNESNIRC